MGNTYFNPKITLSKGAAGTVEIPVNRLAFFAAHPIAGTLVTYEAEGRDVFFGRGTLSVHVAEDPEEVARCILRAVHEWRYSDPVISKSAKESDGACQTEPGKDSEAEHKEHNPAFSPNLAGNIIATLEDGGKITLDAGRRKMVEAEPRRPWDCYGRGD